MKAYFLAIAPWVPFDEALATFRLSVIGAEGLFGEDRVEADLSYRIDDEARSLTVLDTEVGIALTLMYKRFIDCEFGSGSVRILRNVPVPHCN